MAPQVKVIIEKDGKFLLIKRAEQEDAKHFGYWESPGGKVENNESFEDAAFREVKQETGLDVKLKKKIKEIKEDNEIKAVVYLAEPLNEQVSLSQEHNDFGWFTIEEIRSLDKITYKEFFLELLKLAGFN